MELQDRLIEYVKTIGLEDADLEVLKDETADFTPLKDKIFNNYKEALKGDTEFTSQFTKDFDNRLIGNLNKNKKLIRKQFGLDIKEDDLSKMSMEDLLKKAHEVADNTKNADLQEIRNKQIEAHETNERLKEEHRLALEAEQKKTTDFVKSYEVKHKLQNLILKETPIKVDNIDVAIAAYEGGYLTIKGWKLDIDQKGNPILLDAKSGALALVNNAPVKVSDTIKDFFAFFAGKGNGKGSLDNLEKPDPETPVHPSLKLTERIGKGLNAV